MRRRRSNALRASLKPPRRGLRSRDLIFPFSTSPKQDSSSGKRKRETGQATRVNPPILIATLLHPGGCDRGGCPDLKRESLILPGISQPERPAVTDVEWPDQNTVSNPAPFAGFPDPWFFLAYRPGLFVGSKNLRENRVLEFAGFNTLGSPCIHGIVFWFGRRFLRFNDVTI